MNSVKQPFSPLVLVAQWIEFLPGVRKVMGLTPVWDSDFSLPHACFMLICSLFTSFFLKVKNDHRSKFSNLSNWKEET